MDIISRPIEKSIYSNYWTKYQQLKIKDQTACSETNLDQHCPFRTNMSPTEPFA